MSDGDANSSFTFAIVSDYEDGALFNVDSDGVLRLKLMPIMKLLVNI